MKRTSEPLWIPATVTAALSTASRAQPAASPADERLKQQQETAARLVYGLKLPDVEMLTRIGSLGEFGHLTFFAQPIINRLSRHIDLFGNLPFRQAIQPEIPRLVLLLIYLACSLC